MGGGLLYTLVVADSLNARVDRLEEAMQSAFKSIDALADKQAKLDDLAVLLVEAQIKTQERFLETDRRFEETERILRESGERLDARIDKLVSAIGEFIRISGNR